jgi:hypothetical protein
MTMNAELVQVFETQTAESHAESQRPRRGVTITAEDGSDGSTSYTALIKSALLVVGGVGIIALAVGTTGGAPAQAAAAPKPQPALPATPVAEKPAEVAPAAPAATAKVELPAVAAVGAAKPGAAATKGKASPRRSTQAAPAKEATAVAVPALENPY